MIDNADLVFDESQVKGIEIKMLPETCNIVYFDLETWRFRMTDEILDIAASYEGQCLH